MFSPAGRRSPSCFITFSRDNYNDYLRCKSGQPRTFPVAPILATNLFQHALSSPTVPYIRQTQINSTASQGINTVLITALFTRSPPTVHRNILPISGYRWRVIRFRYALWHRPEGEKRNALLYADKEIYRP